MASSEILTQRSGILPGGGHSHPVQSASDALQAIQRQTTYLQQQIQALLDAHSIGLLAGLGQETEAEETARESPITGPIHLPISSTDSTSNGSTRQRRTKRRPSLSTSRRKLCTSLIKLAELKNDEAAALDIHRNSLVDFLDNTNRLEEKKTKIEASIQDINKQTESGEESLELEENSLVEEVATLEKQLEEANSRLKHIRQQRQEGTSRRTARLSSWQGALDEVNRRIKRDVVEGRGLEAVIPDLRSSEKKSTAVNIWKFPRERRTIDLIKEDIKTRITSIEVKRDAAEEEGNACEQGVEILTSVIKKIEELERSLADEMSDLTLNARTKADTKAGENGLVRIVENMTATINDLERELDVAESRGWNLLICIVGAEVEALKQGKDLLQETLHLSRGESTPGTASMMTAQSRMASDLIDEKSPPAGPTNGTSDNDNLLDPSMTSQNGYRTTHPQTDSQYSQHRQDEAVGEDGEDDDDDAPGPDFLIEHDD